MARTSPLTLNATWLARLALRGPDVIALAISLVGWRVTKRKKKGGPLFVDGRPRSWTFSISGRTRSLQQTAAAMLVPRDITAHSAAAAAERVVSCFGEVPCSSVT